MRDVDVANPDNGVSTPTVTVRGVGLIRAEPDEAVLWITLSALEVGPGAALADLARQSGTAGGGSRGGCRRGPQGRGLCEGVRRVGRAADLAERVGRAGRGEAHRDGCVVKFAPAHPGRAGASTMSRRQS